ncbi:MAG TPA: glycosyltransferase, partial [Thermoanaerobaculia bacterium]
MQPFEEIQQPMPGLAPKPDLVCLSHLRWDFVYQRPQHLMSRFARDRRVFFFEEPIFEDGPARLDVSERPGGVRVAVPRLPHGLPPEEVEAAQRDLLQGMLAGHGVSDYVLWYYTPMALGFSAGLAPAAVVYDCMDELSLFRGAPPALLERERRLLEIADLVFTGGQSLYEAKRERHPSVHAFPSSIDAEHFGRARRPCPEPADQAAIPRPRLGYFGVIDERIDLDLLAAAAGARPDWQWVMIGPVVKIDPETLPRRSNLHYLGMKAYDELPSYLAGWDAALMPFAANESTRFISPTKTPEYLAGGRPVVSTPIRDVVRPYGELALVEIAEDPEAFVAAAERSMRRLG